MQILRWNLTANSNVRTNSKFVNLAPPQYRRKDTGTVERGDGKAARDERGEKPTGAGRAESRSLRITGSVGAG